METDRRQTSCWCRTNGEGVGLLMSHVRKVKGFLHCSTTGVYQPNGVVRFASDFGLAGEATGVSPGSSSSKVGPDGQRQLRQTARVGRVEVRVVRAHKVGLILDWVENLDGESMLWAGGGITDEAGHAPTRRIGGGLAAITLRGLNRGSSSRPAALELNVGGVNLFVCSAEPRDGSVRPGYFLYHGAPDEETRRRIREAVGI